MITYSYWFDVPLTCSTCGTTVAGPLARLSVAGLNTEPRGDRWVQAGDVLPIHESDFRDPFITLRDPGTGPAIFVIAPWDCPHCQAINWVRLEFGKVDSGRYRFMSAQAVPPSAEILQASHYFSRSLAESVEAHPGDSDEKIRQMIGSAAHDR